MCLSNIILMSTCFFTVYPNILGITKIKCIHNRSKNVHGLIWILQVCNTHTSIFFILTKCCTLHAIFLVQSNHWAIGNQGTRSSLTLIWNSFCIGMDLNWHGIIEMEGDKLEARVCNTLNAMPIATMNLSKGVSTL